MRIIQIILLICCINCAVFSQQVVYTRSSINLRVSPTKQSLSLYVIPVGTNLIKYDCNNNWCLVLYDGNYGFVYKKYLKSSFVNQPNTRNSYINTRGNRVQSPSYYDSPPYNASAECNDGTYSFSESRRGTCSGHGGVKRWL